MSRLLSNIAFALKGVTRNKVRSFLTLLGILIGIGSVIALQAIGDGAKNQIVGQFESLGSEVITVNQMMPNFGAMDEQMENHDGPPDMDEMQQMQPQIGGNSIDPLTIDDYSHVVEADLNGVQYMSPTMMIEVDSMSVEDGTYSTASITAVDQDYFKIYNLEASEGELFDEMDEEEDIVAVIGKDIVYEDYYDGDNEVILIEDLEIPVVAILKDHEASLFEESANTQVFVHYEAVDQIGYDSSDISMIVIKVDNGDLISSIATKVENLLVDFREEDPEAISFSVFTVEQLTERISLMTETFTMLLSAIAAISLLVGGIGIGNVMLISVTERIREIGIRKAIGARNFDILFQFLLEAIFLSMIGGALGIACGYGLAYIAEQVVNIDPAYSMNNILFATGVSIAVGVVCGFLPALKASRLNPIDALRYE